MLITFKSKSSADVLMYREHAKRVLDLLHKEVRQGVITAAEAPGALTLLEQEIAESRKHLVSDEVIYDVQSHHSDSGDDTEHEAVETVSFATRAFPLLEMLRSATTAGHDIQWGV